MFYAIVALILMTSVFTWYVTYLLRVRPLSIENSALLELLDNHLNRAEHPLDVAVIRSLEDGTSFAEMLDTSDGIKLAGIDVSHIDDGYAWPDPDHWRWGWSRATNEAHDQALALVSRVHKGSEAKR